MDGYKRHKLHKHRIYIVDHRRIHHTSYASQIMLRRQLLKQAVLAGDEYSRFKWGPFRDKIFKRLQHVKVPINCVYCKRKNLEPFTKDRNKMATLDHIMPISKGGKVFDLENLTIACDTCNRGKKDKLPDKQTKTLMGII